MNKLLIICGILFLFSLPCADAFDIWQYPEVADKDSIFAGGFAATFTYSLSNVRDFSFKLDYPEFYLDYVLPFGLPFSFGVSVKNLKPGLLGLGIRPAYHINTGIPNLDLYLLYGVTLDFTEEFGLIQTGGRLGFRYKVVQFFFLNIETGWKFKNVNFGISIKLN